MATDPLSPTVQESSGRVRLCLGNLAHGDGPTLQDAADDLVQRLLTYAMAVQSSGFRISPELGPPDLAAMRLLHELGEIAATGGECSQGRAHEGRVESNRRVMLTGVAVQW